MIVTKTTQQDLPISNFNRKTKKKCIGRHDGTTTQCVHAGKSAENICEPQQDVDWKPKLSVCGARLWRDSTTLPSPRTQTSPLLAHTGGVYQLPGPFVLKTASEESQENICWKDNSRYIEPDDDYGFITAWKCANRATDADSSPPGKAFSVIVAERFSEKRTSDIQYTSADPGSSQRCLSTAVSTYFSDDAFATLTPDSEARPRIRSSHAGQQQPTSSTSQELCSFHSIVDLNNNDNYNCNSSTEIVGASLKFAGSLEEQDFTQGSKEAGCPPEVNPEKAAVSLSPTSLGNRSSIRRSTKLKRRNAYKENRQGRSLSLSSVDGIRQWQRSGVVINTESAQEAMASAGQDWPKSVALNRDLRRKKLIRSQGASCEYFYVCFEQDGGSGIGEIAQVHQGLSIAQVILPFCAKRGLDVTLIDAFVDSAKSLFPTSLAADSSTVANLHVVIKDKSHSSRNVKPSQQLKESLSYKDAGEVLRSSTENNDSLADNGARLARGCQRDSGIGAIFRTHEGSSSTGLLSHEGSVKIKNAKQLNRWGGLFSHSKDNSKMDLLVEQLNQYNKDGIPELKHGLNKDNYFEEIAWAEKELESALGHQFLSTLSEGKRQQQAAIWELVQTELIYIKTIKVITDLFLSCLCNLQLANILTEIDRDKLFSNIADIYVANRSFWMDCILPMVQKAKDSQNPLQPTDLLYGFLNFGTIFHPYTKYCLDQIKCQQYCREKYHENECFKAYLAWCETRKECNRLRLIDILVRPMQRMTKYSLLLKAILRNTEDTEQVRHVEDMVRAVEHFVKSVNGTLRSRQDLEKLHLIADSIDSYDVVETKDEDLENLVKAYSKLDLLNPMPFCGTLQRWLLLEGDLKLKDGTASKVEFRCFLFTDMLLFCKPQGKKGDKMKVSKQPMFVDRIVCSELGKDTTSFGIVYLNEFKTAIAAFSLHSNNEPAVARQWIEAIRKAQAIYRQAREKVQIGSKDGEDDTAISGFNFTYLTSRSPRGGDSSRGSQISSLIHSHSGSIEIGEPCILPTRAISFEQELRGSSLSSDEGVPNVEGNPVSRSCFDDASNAVSVRSSSPRIERRYMFKSPTPNMLTVNMPTRGLSGHSLPDLSAMPDSPAALHHSQQQQVSLTVPKSPLSPNQRGISYPPPSTRSLCRSQAILCTPPLLKGRNVYSTETVSSWPSCDVQLPENERKSSTEDNLAKKNIEFSNSASQNQTLPQPSLSSPRVTRSGLLAGTTRSASSDSSSIDSTFAPGNTITEGKISARSIERSQEVSAKFACKHHFIDKTLSELVERDKMSSAGHPRAPRSQDNTESHFGSIPDHALSRDAKVARQKFFSCDSYDNLDNAEQDLRRQLAVSPHADGIKSPAVFHSSPRNDATSSNESAQCAVCIAVCEPDQIIP